MKEYLFVYGSLKRESENNLSAIDKKMHLLLAKHSEFIGKAICYGKLYLIDNYPGAVLSNIKSNIIHGEVYKILDSSILSHLDEYEECSPDFSEPTKYKREKCNVYIDGNVIKSWIFTYNRSVKGKKEIKSGKW
jgi:gamma-glutamylcyclotransferase (GGCT)/AIG2-like uncharacterized protein YtfP